MATTATRDVAIVIGNEESARETDDDHLPGETDGPSFSYSKLVPPAAIGRLSKEDIGAFVEAQIKEHNRELGLEMDQVQPHPLFFSRSAALSFKGISFSVQLFDPATKKKVEKMILAPCSGHFAPGTLAAIMGPSGCGKSTLLDILAARKTSAYEGEVLLNGRARDRLYSRVSAYVPQEDRMYAHLTVKETITFNFLLARNLPSGGIQTELRKNLPKVIEMHLTDLGLAKVADTKIGNHEVRGISGGQKRRVTLSKGLLSGASLLFCDEPTSGLSSTDAEVAVKRMKFFTKKMGVTILVVIHQPKQEVAALFDHLLLLTSEPGRVVYNGPMREAFAYYADVGHPVPSFVNPADFYLDLVSPSFAGQAIEQFVAYYNEHCAAAVLKQVDAQIASPGLSAAELLKSKQEKITAAFGPPARAPDAPFAAPFGRQILIVFARAVTLRRRDVAALRADFFASVVKGLIVGIAFLDVGSRPALNQIPFIFMALQMSIMSGMQQMPRAILNREIMKLDVADRLYTEWAFILSDFLLNNTISQLANLVFLIIAFSMSGVGFDLFGSFYAWQILTILTTDSMFALIGAIGKTAEQSQSMAIPPLLFCIIFNGFFVTLKGVQSWMKWAIYISPVFYGIQQIAVELFNDGVPRTSPGYTESGQFVIDYYDFRTDMAGISLAVLLGMTSLFRIGQVVALNKLNSPQK
ncbi:hypothetical protein AB1Y20_011905 [Prymnesium parvum]|uniref:ABC transporter domain-containing protein n=1 Tax=Prymnesium parvum TaxID=97485 RepID=A0AB34IHW1_PRYPA